MNSAARLGRSFSLAVQSPDEQILETFRAHIDALGHIPFICVTREAELEDRCRQIANLPHIIILEATKKNTLHSLRQIYKDRGQQALFILMSASIQKLLELVSVEGVIGTLLHASDPDQFALELTKAIKLLRKKKRNADLEARAEAQNRINRATLCLATMHERRPTIPTRAFKLLQRLSRQHSLSLPHTADKVIEAYEFIHPKPPRRGPKKKIS